MMTAVPDDWRDRSDLHRRAWEHCQRNAVAKPADCICCGCHTDQVDAGIPADHIKVMIGEEACPAEKRALARILLSRAITG